MQILLLINNFSGLLWLLAFDTSCKLRLHSTFQIDCGFWVILKIWRNFTLTSTTFHNCRNRTLREARYTNSNRNANYSTLLHFTSVTVPPLSSINLNLHLEGLCSIVSDAQLNPLFVDYLRRWINVLNNSWKECTERRISKELLNVSSLSVKYVCKMFTKYDASLKRNMYGL